MKRQKVEEALDVCLDEIEENGASFLKYEFVKKRDKKVLQARRCSMRNVPIGFQSYNQNPLKMLEMTGSKVDMSFEYNPTNFEGLFAKDKDA